MKSINIGYRRGTLDFEQEYNRIVSAMFMLKERRNMNSFVFTGCESQVGNTTICLSIAAELAKTGRKTLLVDCDFLKPAEEKRLYQYVDAGLAQYLEDKCNIEDIFYQTDIPKLHYISSGKQFTNPTIMLWSEKFVEFLEYAKSQYEFIIFDTAPVLSAPEVSVLTYRTSGTILTVQCGKSLKSQIYAAKKDIESMSSNFLGVIVNKTPREEYKIYQKNHGFSAIIRGVKDQGGNENE